MVWKTISVNKINIFKIYLYSNPRYATLIIRCNPFTLIYPSLVAFNMLFHCTELFVAPDPNGFYSTGFGF